MFYSSLINEHGMLLSIVLLICIFIYTCECEHFFITLLISFLFWSTFCEYFKLIFYCLFLQIFSFFFKHMHFFKILHHKHLFIIDLVWLLVDENFVLILFPKCFRIFGLLLFNINLVAYSCHGYYKLNFSISLF